MQTNKVVLSVGLLVAAMLAGCGTTIQPGHVGIVVDKFGTNRGVQDYTIRTGWVSYNPFSSWVIEYPVFVQTVQWTKSLTEGNPVDESITFTTKESVQINADISLSYQLATESVPTFYVKFRNSEIKDFTYGYMHNVARDAMMEIGGHYTVEQVMGDNEQFLHDVRDRIGVQLRDIGISVTQFGFIGAPRPPQQVIQAINAAQQAKYLALQKQNELQQATAEAAKVTAYAQGEANAIVARAEGQSKANRLLNESLSDKVLERSRLDVQWHWIEKWNGQMPQVSSGSNTGMLYNLLTPTTPKQ